VPVTVTVADAMRMIVNHSAVEMAEQNQNRVDVTRKTLHKTMREYLDFSSFQNLLHMRPSWTALWLSRSPGQCLMLLVNAKNDYTVLIQDDGIEMSDNFQSNLQDMKYKYKVYENVIDESVEKVKTDD